MSSNGPALTWEARWFFPGELPEAVIHALFPRAGAAPARGWSRPRTDRYLVFSAEMGIKLRDEPGRAPLLEFKGRLAPPEETRFGSAGVGMADGWAKWSLPAGEVPRGLVSAVRDGTRVRFVTKTRLLTVLELQSDGGDRPVAPGVRVERGVQLELSRIQVHRDAPPAPESFLARAWSVSFEAFPLAPDLPSRVPPAVIPWLERAAAAGVTLDRVRSRAYPAWLLGLD